MKKSVAIVGGGPAGLWAADQLSKNPDLDVTIYDAMPSVGRKFLVAGKGGLNITHSEPLQKLITRYSGPSSQWEKWLPTYSPDKLRGWVHSLGIETYIGTSGRVFPVGQQSAKLLRSWVSGLRQAGVTFRSRHQWHDLRKSQTGTLELDFTTPGGAICVGADAILFALGGASWPQTGSTGKWVDTFRTLGIECASLEAANCGWEVRWPADILPRIEGKPLKNIAVHAGKLCIKGELLITSYGLEGGALYTLGSRLRAMKRAQLIIDWKPAMSEKQLYEKLGRVTPEETFLRACKAWNLSNECELLLARAGAREVNVKQLIRLIKYYAITLEKPRPIDEAISSAGGVKWDEVNEGLMLRKWPGVFVAGEMLDWEAPTGGYLLQGSFTTGHQAASGIADYLRPL